MKRSLTFLILLACGTARAQTLGIRANTSLMLGGLQDTPVQEALRRPEHLSYVPNGQYLGIGLQIRSGTYTCHEAAMQLNDVCLGIRTGLRFGKPAASRQ